MRAQGRGTRRGAPDLVPADPERRDAAVSEFIPFFHFVRVAFSFAFSTETVLASSGLSSISTFSNLSNRDGLRWHSCVPLCAWFSWIGSAWLYARVVVIRDVLSTDLRHGRMPLPDALHALQVQIEAVGKHAQLVSRQPLASRDTRGRKDRVPTVSFAEPVSDLRQEVQIHEAPTVDLDRVLRAAEALRQYTSAAVAPLRPYIQAVVLEPR